VRDTLGNVTTLKIKKETKELLAEIGKKMETYDDIIRRLIEFTRKNVRKHQKYRFFI
jgi:hypothetical protein